MFIFQTLYNYRSNIFIYSLKTLILKMRMLHLQVGPEPDQGGTRAQAPSAWLQLERKRSEETHGNSTIWAKSSPKVKKQQFHIVTFKSSQRLQTGNGGEHDVVNAELHIYAVTGADVHLISGQHHWEISNIAKTETEIETTPGHVTLFMNCSCCNLFIPQQYVLANH